MLHNMVSVDALYEVSASSVLDMITVSAKQQEEAPAVVCGEQVLSYSELLLLAQKNADRLLRAGVKPGEFVLCGLATGVELPIAWIATMLARAVLVPIDPQWPSARLNSVLEITNAGVAIVPAIMLHLALNSGKVSLMEIELSGTGEDVVMSVPALSGDDLLYGFFTSGSTGTPKCALNHHAGVMNRFSYMTRRFGQGHRVYQNSAPLFDSSIWQLLWPLTSGGVSILPQSRDHWSVEALVDVVEQYRITMTDFVPTLFKTLVRSIEHRLVPAEKLQSLKYVLIGGEAIDSLSVHTFRRFLPDTRIINTYGHTEASIGMVFHEVCDEDGDDIPLGAPIDNTYVRIVDEDLREVPQGTFGEIVVAGVCVGGGYLNAPELTERAFLPNPFDDLPGAMVYRTGDLGRVRGDGLLEFAGRIDDQVKVRGVRIELNEISIAMRECKRRSNTRPRHAAKAG
jgi:amino acid adenylation domain-containing protein